VAEQVLVQQARLVRINKALKRALGYGITIRPVDGNVE
jgi:hypothetical protein